MKWWRYLAALVLGSACAAVLQAADEVPVFKCEAYGRLIDCRLAPLFERRAVMWSIEPTAGEIPSKKSELYRAAGASFTYPLRSNAVHTIELHFIDWTDAPVFRRFAKWKKDRDGVWKVMFAAEAERMK